MKRREFEALLAEHGCVQSRDKGKHAEGPKRRARDRTLARGSKDVYRPEHL